MITFSLSNQQARTCWYPYYIFRWTSYGNFPYNTNLISSCPKLTSNSVWTPETEQRAGGSRDTQCGDGDGDGDGGNSRFASSSSIGEGKDNPISHLLTTKDGPRSNQLIKILEAILHLCYDKHYDYFSDISSINTEPTQEYFLSNHLIKRQCPSKHHAKLGVVDHFIGLDVPSGNIPINSNMVENTPISNPYPQAQHHPDNNQGSFTRSHE